MADLFLDDFSSVTIADVEAFLGLNNPEIRVRLRPTVGAYFGDES